MHFTDLGGNAKQFRGNAFGIKCMGVHYQNLTAAICLNIAQESRDASKCANLSLAPICSASGGAASKLANYDNPSPKKRAAKPSEPFEINRSNVGDCRMDFWGSVRDIGCCRTNVSKVTSLPLM